MNIIGSI